MKPFVAMPMECATRRSGGISVDDCAKTEILVCAFGADSGPGMVHGARVCTSFKRTNSYPSSLTIGDQNASRSCRFSSDFKQSAVLSVRASTRSPSLTCRSPPAGREQPRDQHAGQGAVQHGSEAGEKKKRLAFPFFFQDSIPSPHTSRLCKKKYKTPTECTFLQDRCEVLKWS